MYTHLCLSSSTPKDVRKSVGKKKKAIKWFHISTPHLLVKYSLFSRKTFKSILK